MPQVHSIFQIKNSNYKMCRDGRFSQTWSQITFTEPSVHNIKG